MVEGRAMRASQLLGREAVDIDTGRCAGAVRDLLLSRAGQLLCAGIQPADWFAPGLACPADSIIAASSGRLLYGGCGNLRRLRPPRGRTFSLWSFLALKPLVSRDGASLGILEDLSFDLPTGRLISAFVSQSHGPLEEIAVERLTATGPDCVIAALRSLEPEPDEAEETSGAETGAVTPGLFDAVVEEDYSAPFVELARGDQEPGIVPTEGDEAQASDAEGAVESTCAGLDAPVIPEAQPISRATRQRILPRQPEPEEMEARLTDILLASAEALSRQGEQAQAETLVEPDAEAAVELGGFRALEALVIQRGARGATRLQAVQPKAEDESMRLFVEPPTLDPLHRLEGFEQRKAQYLAGRIATRDIHAPSGKLIARQGEELTSGLLVRIIEAGQLDSVFLEHAALTR